MPTVHAFPVPAMSPGDYVTSAVLVGRDYLPGRVITCDGGWYSLEYPFDGDYRVAKGFVPVRKHARGC